MKRSALEIGGLYVGPGLKCYEIVDMSPGWRIDASGDWVEEPATRTRHMPGKGNVPYRTNLAIQVYIHEVGSRRKAVVDPRKLSGTWEEFQRDSKDCNRQRKHAEAVMKTARQVIRTRPGFRPSSAGLYRTTDDGSMVTLPTEDLAALTGIAHVPNVEPQGSANVTWSS
jgi:hypothetical protein